jgi:hypothetical protein
MENSGKQRSKRPERLLGEENADPGLTWTRRRFEANDMTPKDNVLATVGSAQISNGYLQGGLQLGGMFKVNKCALDTQLSDNRLFIEAMPVWKAAGHAHSQLGLVSHEFPGDRQAHFYVLLT